MPACLTQKLSGVYFRSIGLMLSYGITNSYFEELWLTGKGSPPKNSHFCFGRVNIKQAKSSQLYF